MIIFRTKLLFINLNFILHRGVLSVYFVVIQTVDWYLTLYRGVDWTGRLTSSSRLHHLCGNSQIMYARRHRAAKVNGERVALTARGLAVCQQQHWDQSSPYVARITASLSLQVECGGGDTTTGRTYRGLSPLNVLLVFHKQQDSTGEMFKFFFLLFFIYKKQNLLRNTTFLSVVKWN